MAWYFLLLLTAEALRRTSYLPRSPLLTAADVGGAWPSLCHATSSAASGPSDFTSAMKQPQSNTALLAHKWTFTQFSSVRTLRPQRTQLLSIAVTPFGPASALAEGPLPLRYASITHPFSVRPPSQNHQGVAPNFRDADARNAASVPSAFRAFVLRW